MGTPQTTGSEQTSLFVAELPGLDIFYSLIEWKLGLIIAEHGSITQDDHNKARSLYFRFLPRES
jgi:hypothetical protein